jgi:hypothetical protein
MAERFYDSQEWRELSERAIERDGGRCLVAWIFGGRCSGRLDGHHIVPRAEAPGLELDIDNVLTACARHHPMVEALRRQIIERRDQDERRYRCPHKHVTAEGRRQCEARRRRELVAA